MKWFTQLKNHPPKNYENVSCKDANFTGFGRNNCTFTQQITHLKKSASENFLFSRTSSEKSMKFENFWWNNCVFRKTIRKKLLISKNQLGKKCFCKIDMHLCSQIKQKTHISQKTTVKNVWISQIFRESNIYWCNQSWKKARDLAIFNDIIAYVNTTNSGGKKVMYFKKSVFKKNRINDF